MRRGGRIAALVMALAVGLSACATYYVPRSHGRAAGVALVTAGATSSALARLTADMDPAMLALARRHDPQRGRTTDYWGRAIGWAVLDIDTAPSLGLLALSDEEEARRVNALKPFNLDDIRTAAPFVLPSQGLERDRAVQCLTQAVYYEAAAEPIEGRRAVAQTVLNRLRHPGYPKSVCGVVFEGAARTTGCQFSFTCDGSLARPPIPWLWEQARDVAVQALGGYVERAVGTATHYHADYVLPYWAPTLLKLRQVGTHIFYRWTGPAGEPRAFSGRYAGGEARVSAEILNGVDERIQGANLAGGGLVPPAPIPTFQRVPGIDGMVSVIAVPDPKAPGGQRLQVTGTIASRRIPNADEIARINALLADLPESKATPAPAP